MNPAHSIRGLGNVFGSLSQVGFRLRRIDASPVQGEAIPEPEVQESEAEEEAPEFRIVGVQQMCRGKDECQDAFGSDQGENWFIACVADGAGSSPCGRQGAQTAVASVLRSLGETEEPEPRSMIADAFRAAHEALIALSTAEQREIKDFRTTLAVAVGNRERIVAGHVGDSLVVVADEQGIRPILRPKNGEFGNTTFFITAADYESHLQFAETEGKWTGLAMQTDGLEAVTYWKHRDDLEAATYQALFSILERSEVDVAQEELSLFVSEDAIMDKCNDDLTLLCVVPILPHADARASDCPTEP